MLHQPKPFEDDAEARAVAVKEKLDNVVVQKIDPKPPKWKPKDKESVNTVNTTTIPITNNNDEVEDESPEDIAKKEKEIAARKAAMMAVNLYSYVYRKKNATLFIII